VISTTWRSAWIVLLRRLPRLEYDPAAGTLGGYVGKIAGREAARHVRRRSRHPDDRLTAELVSALFDPNPTPVSEWERKEQRDKASAIIARIRPCLADQTYRILDMRWVDGATVRKIAATFGVSVDCMKKRLLQALQAAQALLREEEPV
jgi:RNA polymerase sigma factor (sigma-70 family)